MNEASHPLRATLLFLSTFLFPAVGFPLIGYAWWLASGKSWAFVAVVMGLPVVFGYVMPGIAVHVAKRWRFTSGPRVGSYYVHHGFVYGSKLAFALLVVVRSFATIESWWHSVAIMLVTGAVTAFGGWFHDVHAVRAGRIEIDGGIEALSTFAPPSYFSMGASYAAVALAAKVILSRDPAALPWVFPLGLVVLCAVPTIVLVAVDPVTRRAIASRVRAGSTSFSKR